MNASSGQKPFAAQVKSWQEIRAKRFSAEQLAEIDREVEQELRAMKQQGGISPAEDAGRQLPIPDENAPAKDD
jgi:hypothetical protein